MYAEGWKHEDGERKECIVQVSVARMVWGC